jgi:hypothetical protein
MNIMVDACRKSIATEEVKLSGALWVRTVSRQTLEKPIKLGAEGARRYIPLNLSGKRTKLSFLFFKRMYL